MQGRSAEAPAQVVHRRKRIRKLDDDVEKFIDSERPEALVYGVLETTAPLRGARLVQTQRAPRELERRRVQPPEQRRERLFVKVTRRSVPRLDPRRSLERPVQRSLRDVRRSPFAPAHRA